MQIKRILESYRQLKNILHKKSKQNISILYIPESNKKIQKINLSHLSLYSIIGISSVAVVLIIVGFLFHFNNTILISSKNAKLELALQKALDETARLEEICENQQQSILLIKDQAEEVAAVYEQRLQDIQVLKDEANTLIMELNESEKVNIKIPTSREFNRELEVHPMISSSENQPLDEQVLDTLVSLVENNQITELVKADTEEYAKLIKNVENTFDFLESRPDLRPTNGSYLSGFGMRIHPITKVKTMHKGQDIANDIGTEIRAAGSGVVVYSDYQGSFGNLIIIDHGYGYKSLYAHNSKLIAKKGDHVKKGDKISEMGSTGRSTGSHLHFEIHYNGEAIDPMHVLK